LVSEISETRLRKKKKTLFKIVLVCVELGCGFVKYLILCVVIIFFSPFQEYMYSDFL